MFSSNYGSVSQRFRDIVKYLSKTAKKLPHPHLTPPPQRTPNNIRINFILLETAIFVLHFLLLIVLVYLHSYFRGELRKTDV